MSDIITDGNYGASIVIGDTCYAYAGPAPGEIPTHPGPPGGSYGSCDECEDDNQPYSGPGSGSNQGGPPSFQGP